MGIASGSIAFLVIWLTQASDGVAYAIAAAVTAIGLAELLDAKNY